MNVTDLKIALIGVSHWHVPLYLPGLPQGTVVGISDDDAALAASMAAPFGAKVYTDYRQLLKECQPDFVFAFAPHYRMRELALDLIAAGVGFTIEKPAGLNAHEVAEIYDRAEQKKAFCAIPFVWRYSDTVTDLKEKYLKDPIVHMSYKFVAGPPSRYLATSRWMLERKLAGGGCMTNLGVHFIDMALNLTDCTTAEVLGSIYQYASPYDIETYATSLLRLSNGTSLVLETGYAYPMSENLKRENRWTIVTTQGYNILAENNLELRHYDEPTRNISLNTDSDPYYEIFARVTLNDFVSGIRPRASLKEMLATSIILDQMNALADAQNKTKW
ncbi:MAG: Gfo/Idh/MocA family oxidoreductase [Candidatus Anaerobiospirillum merdipullorum]|uniref:Gfo/Idh/MocA family oxidoreductase n=1 Tax=Candidatus Anaerobiospirillum merdipullorum TaxID=2838450 RepID=A0A9E2KMF7_9GAMM|nr:Gfo/Idh/MocA family oxidoreductase [Candidatus Anaerobiospirillum merdipullorum]